MTFINQLRDSLLIVCTSWDRPYGIWAFFKAFVTIPFQNKDSSAGGIVLEIMRNLLLRREKSMKDKHGDPIVPLPEKKFIMVSYFAIIVVALLTQKDFVSTRYRYRGRSSASMTK